MTKILWIASIALLTSACMGQESPNGSRLGSEQNSGPGAVMSPNEAINPQPTNPNAAVTPSDANAATNPNTSTVAPGLVSDSPFSGAVLYGNPGWTSEVTGSAAASTGDAQTLLQKVAAEPVAVWFDTTASLDGDPSDGNKPSLAGHLTAAAAKAAQAGKPAVATFVVYNLPNRDCAAGASAGGLSGTAGLASYKTDYIDKMAATIGQDAYKNVRVALIIEPDSLPNMVVNANIPACGQVASQGIYVDGITYAIQKLGALPNVSLYLDIGQAGWLGWTTNMQAAVTYYTKFIMAATQNKPSMIRGFSTNISNYVPIQEPYISAANTALLDGNFYQKNAMFDDLTYVKALQQQFTAAGIPNMHFITDTSRNGWAKVNNGQPIDGRPARSDWCNVANAGLGERPQATPALWAGYDAFVWVKPPGESDGASTDGSCLSSNPALDAMAGAPAAGTWFGQGLLEMAQHATPAF